MASRRNSRTRAFITTASLIVLCAVSDARAFRYVKVGEPAPALVVDDLGGTEVKPSFFGRLTVVVFWKHDQPFSLAALQDLQALYRDLQGNGVEVLAVTEPSAGAGQIATVARDHALSFPFFIDRGRHASETYGVIVYPSTGIVARNGTLLYYQPSRNSNYKEIIEGNLKVALGLMSEQALTQALARMGEPFGEDREKALVRNREGLALFEAGKTEEAARALAEAVHLYPEYQDAHVHLGYVLLESGEVRSALKEFESVRQQNPLSPQARIGIGVAHLRLGEVDKGIGLLEEAVSLNPDPVRGYAELGRAYETKGDLAKALYCYRRAVQKLLQGRK